MKKLILCSLLASVSSLALASARVQLPISQPVVAPQASSTVSVESLKSGVVYNIICNIDSTNDDTYLKVSTSSLGAGQPLFVLNGNPAGSQMIVSKGDNTMEVLNFIYADNGMIPASLVFENLDNDGTLTIKQCFANPSTSAYK